MGRGSGWDVDQENGRTLVIILGSGLPLCGGKGDNGLALGVCHIAGNTKQRVGAKGGGQEIDHPVVTVRRLDKDLSLAKIATASFKVAESLGLFAFADWEIAIERESLAVEPGGHERQKDA